MYCAWASVKKAIMFLNIHLRTLGDLTLPSRTFLGDHGRQHDCTRCFGTMTWLCKCRGDFMWRGDTDISDLESIAHSSICTYVCAAAQTHVMPRIHIHLVHITSREAIVTQYHHNPATVYVLIICSCMLVGMYRTIQLYSHLWNVHWLCSQCLSNTGNQCIHPVTHSYNC